MYPFYFIIRTEKSSPCPKGNKSRAISVRNPDATQIKLLPQSKIKGRNLVPLKALPEMSTRLFIHN